jgi:hypothetical protein
MAQPGQAQHADDDLREYQAVSIEQLERRFAEGKRNGQVRLN